MNERTAERRGIPFAFVVALPLVSAVALLVAGIVAFRDARRSDVSPAMCTFPHVPWPTCGDVQRRISWTRFYEAAGAKPEEAECLAGVATDRDPFMSMLLGASNPPLRDAMRSCEHRAGRLDELNRRLARYAKGHAQFVP